MDKILEIFHSNRRLVCIQGLGFVGAAMALAVASSKDKSGIPHYNVIGIDIPTEEGYRKTSLLNRGEFPFENKDKKLQQTQKEVYQNGNLWATTDPLHFQYADVVIVDINLDIQYTKEHQPVLNLNLFKDAMHTLAKNVKAGALIIVETTVPPGTCEKIVYPIFCEEFEKRNIDKSQIYIAHSYERVMPGENYFDSIVNYWRVYSGINKLSADKCQKFLETIINTQDYPLTRLEKTTATETAKVLENSYRAANIAFIEEWGRFAEAVGIDLFEVIDAIRMRPTHSNIRQPGFGVGGYCLTKDPYFAPLAAKDIFNLEDIQFPFSVKAVDVNNAMPLVSLNKIQNLLGGTLAEKKLLILGVSYREDIGDTRHSPTEIFVKEALKRGAAITCQDPLIEYWKEMDMQIICSIPDFRGYDAVVFTVQHKQYLELDFKREEFDNNTLIFDANCVLSKSQREELSNLNNIRYVSIGR